MKNSLKNNAFALAFLVTSSECFTSIPAASRGLSTRLPSPPAAGAVLTNSGAGSRVRRFASTVVPPPPETNPDDEVQRLREMAAKLRQEASGLEAEQKAAVAQAAARVFRKFDTDKNGEVTVQELKQGLEKMFKMELPDKRANQLMQNFDVNGDGVLQLQEFVGVDRIRNTLDAIVREERDAARQQAKNAQEQEAAKQLQATQLELVNDKPPTVSDKALSVLPYLFPLLDGLQFASFFVEKHPDNPLAIAAFAAYALYRSIPFGGFLSFLALSFLSDNPRINRLVRFNMQQAVFLDIALFVPAIVATLGYGLLNAAGVSLAESVVEVGNDIVFVTLLATIGYTTVSSLLGQTPNKIPGISQRVEDRMVTPDMFDAEGRFAPFDEEGNRKNTNKDKKENENQD